MSDVSTVGARRLHPATLLVNFVQMLEWYVVPASLMIVAGSGLRWYFWSLAGGFVCHLGWVVARYASFRYSLDLGRLCLTSGLVSRRRREIPIEQVQDLRIRQGPLLRLCGLAAVSVETAGAGGDAEGELDFLRHSEAQRLRSVIRAGKDGPEIAEDAREGDPGDPLYSLDNRGLLLAAATDFRVTLVIAVAFAIYGFAEDLAPGLAEWFEQATASIWDAEGSDARRALLRVALVAGALVLGFLLSLAGTFALFHRFSLVRKGGDLIRRYGLFVLNSTSLPASRIQGVVIDEGPLRRPFGLMTIRAASAGSVDDPGTTGQGVLVPIARRGELGRLLGRILPGLPDPDRLEWRRVSPRTVGRSLRKALLLLGAGTALLWLALGPWSLLVLCALPGSWWVARLRFRTLGYRIEDGFFHLRRGWLGKRTFVVPVSRLQSIRVDQNPFDRRLGLATLSIDVAGMELASLPDLEAQVARDLADTLARASE